MTRTVDAVVVGAGHNGLVAANLLADAGWDVLVLEATSAPGGSVRTAELTVPGFHHDVCSAFYPLAAASPVISELGLADHGLVWRHAPAVLAHVLPDDRCALLSRDLNETAASVGAFADADADAWVWEARRWEQIAGPLIESVLRPFPPIRPGLRLLRAVGAGHALELARLALLSTRQYGAERFQGEGARLLLAGNALHTDLGPEQAGSAIYGWLLAMLGQSVGFPVPEGGAGALTDALLRRLERRGGVVECDRPVRAVLHARGVAVGVRDAAGELVRAKRAVLADVPAPALYEDLVGLDALPADFAANVRRFQWDNATVKVDWALSAPIPWTARPARRAGTVHLGGDLDDLSRYSARLARALLPDKPFVVVGQMSTADPSRSPAGAEAVWAYTHIPQEYADHPDASEGQAELIEDLIEAHAPGFRGSIIARVTQSPADLRAHNPSLVGGALNGGTAAPHQQLFLRPTPGLGRADTPIDRLYLASASAHPGGGVHGAAGANAARAALARCGRAGRAYAAAIRCAHRLLW